MRSSIAVRSVFLLLALSLLPAASQAGVFVSVAIAPPVLPVYVQPPLPAPGYIWTPGYWAYGPDGYFWVPGTWVLPPQPGLLWTPGYWGWRNGLYVWNGGYWGPHVGFYGGVNYGFGYTGVGFYGGRWVGGVFSYNAAVMNVGLAGVRSYRENVVVNNIHTSYNGGAGGLRAQPTAFERSAMAEHHFEATREQNLHHEMASHDRGQLASVNHGHPGNMAMSRPRGAGAPAAHAAGPAAHGGAPSHAGPAASHAGGGAASHAGPAASHAGGGAPGHAGGAPSHAAPAASRGPSGGHPSGGGQAHPSGGSSGGAKGGGAKPAGHPGK